jgi:hypothetical protein
VNAASESSLPDPRVGSVNELTAGTASTMGLSVAYAPVHQCLPGADPPPPMRLAGRARAADDGA